MIGTYYRLSLADEDVGADKAVLVKIANTLSVSADELLLDCLEYPSSSANSEIHRLLLDCNETEQTVIIRMAKELKAILVSLGV